MTQKRDRFRKSGKEHPSESDESGVAVNSECSSLDPLSLLGQRLKPVAGEVLNQVQDAGQGVVDLSRDLAHKASEEIDARGVAGGVIAMSAGEAVGMAIGGVLGSVAGPGGTLIGSQIGGFAGSSLGARYGYDLAVDSKDDPDASARIVAPSEVLSKRGAAQLGEAMGEAGGTTLGSAFGASRAGRVLGRLAGEMGGVIAEHAVDDGREPPEQTEAQSEKSYRKAPTKAWFKRIAKENLAETLFSGALGAAGGLLGGGLGQKLAERAGVMTARHLDFTEPEEPEFVSPPAADEAGVQHAGKEGIPASGIKGEDPDS